MEKPVPIHFAKAHLSKLIEAALRGESVVISKGKTPVVRLVPVDSKDKVERRFGALKGKAVVDDRFFEPLPEDELKRWE